MASNELIDEVISPKASQQVVQLTNDLEKLSLQFEATFKNAKALTDALEGAKGISGTTSGASQIKKELDEIQRLKQATIQTEIKLAGAITDENYALQEQKIALAKVNAEVKDKIKYNQAEVGSINEMRSKLKQLQADYDAMGKSSRDAFGAPLLKNIQAVDTELKKLEGGSGRFQRNVGNYSNATFQLSQSLRELPAFAFSAQTGILALSNNLPMLVDSFNQVKASTGSAGSALAVFAKSVFTFTNLFTIALGLFTVFYKEIMQFVGVTKKGSEAMDSFKKSSADASGEIAKLTIQVFDFHKGIASKESVLNTYNNSMGKLYGEAKNVLEVEESLNKNAETYIKYTGLKAQAVNLLAEAVKTYNENSELQKKDDWWTTLKAQASTMFKDIASGGQITFGFNALKNPSYALSQYKKAAAEEAHTAMLAFADIQRQIDEMEKNKPFGTTKKAKSKKEQEVNHIDELKNQYENERKVAQTAYNNGEMDYLNFQLVLLDIDKKYVEKRIQARNQKEKDSLIDLYLEISKNTKESFKGLGQLAADSFEKGFKNFKSEQAKGIAENMVEKAKEDLEKFKTYLETAPKADISIKSKDLIDWEQFRRDADDFLAYLQDMISAFGNLGMEARRAELYEIDVKENKLNESYKAEQDRINKSYTNRAQKEQELIKLDARKEAQQKQIDRERLQATIRAAKFQKGIDIAELVAKTAQAVMAGYTKSGLVGAAMAGALGAVQLATIMARPLPQFAKGTESSPEGYAVVGEKGTELVTDPSGKSWLTPAKDTITYLKKGSKVTTNEKLMEMVKNSAYVQLANLNTPVTSDMYSKTLVEQFETLTSEFKALKGVMQDKAMSVQIQGNYDHYIHVRNNIR